MPYHASTAELVVSRVKGLATPNGDGTWTITDQQLDAILAEYRRTPHPDAIRD